MKKIILASAFIGIFAGFLGNVSAEELGNGISTSKCNRVYVKLKTTDDGKRQWSQEDCLGESKEGCRLRSCTYNEGDTWPKDQCNKYCVGLQEYIPIGNKKVKSISGNSGTDLAMNYVSMIYKFGASILGIFAVLVIVISGVQIIAGGADENNISSAKDRILQALLSLAMLFSSALILRTINPDFFT